MSEDWNSPGTGRRRAPNRELSALRAKYISHRDTLSRLAADAPTGHMAQLYERVTSEIDSAIRKLDDLDKGDGGALAIPLPNVEEPSRPVHPAMVGAEDRIEEREWQTGAPETYSPVVQRDQSGLRKALLALVALAAIAFLGFFAWSATRDDSDSPVIVDETVAAGGTTPEPTPAVVEAGPLAINPSSFDFGAVERGTRKSGRFQIANNTGAPMPLAVSRSQCRCLWFQHPQIIPANSTATLTITVDAARVKSGGVDEIVTVSSKDDSAVTADIEVTAAVQ